jgi:hypothetical protein
MLMTKNFRLARRWMIALLAAVLLSGTAITLASPATLATLTGTGGSGYEPLTINEQNRALQALMETGSVARTLELPARTGVASVTDAIPAAPAEAVLLVERHQESKEAYASGRWQRRADVYIYRYADDTLMRQIYNLDTKQVDQVDTVQGMQLPLTIEEQQRALAIALADPQLRPQLDAEFQLITNQPLTGADQLIVKAMTFHADSVPNTDLGAAAQCGIKRCAQLLLAAGDNMALRVIPVVDLSSGVAVKALPFTGAPQ